MPQVGDDRGRSSPTPRSIPWRERAFGSDLRTGIGPITRSRREYILVARKFGEAVQKHGPESVAFYGSGQWTVNEGYAALKFMKAGLGSDNIEANARLCMASAVAGFMTTFGGDEPMGCYDDIAGARADRG